eukprot:gene10331-2747_t
MNKSPKKRKHLEIKSEYSSSSERLKIFEEQYPKIQKQREKRDAPVDSMGAECISEKNVEPNVFRFQTLISLMLSSQTKDEITSAAMKKLINHGLTIENILKLDKNELEKLIYPVGFYKRKSEYILKTSLILKEKYNNDTPTQMSEILKLPGVGPKMAPLFMKIALNKTIGIGVDVHVHRIVNRLGWIKTKTPEESEKELIKIIPKEYW